MPHSQCSCYWAGLTTLFRFLSTGGNRGVVLKSSPDKETVLARCGKQSRAGVKNALGIAWSALSELKSEVGACVLTEAGGGDGIVRKGRDSD